MIQNLNFYDVYGYLLPGLTFLLLIWLPKAVIRPHVPSGEWSSAIVAVAVAYIAGHILQMMAQGALPSDVKGHLGRRRVPSDWILDANNKTFSPEFKARLWKRIIESFEIDVDITTLPSDFDEESLDDISKKRQDAFMLCRSALVRGKSVFYGEQLEGMYALMRGLTAAFGIGAIYHLGWTAAVWSNLVRDKWIAISFMVVFIVIVFVSLSRSKQEPNAFALVIVTLLVAVALSGECQVGWLTGRWSWVAVGFGMTCAVLSAVLFLDLARFKKQKLTLAWLKALPVLFALFAMGYSLGAESPLDINRKGVLILIAISELFIAVNCYGSYKYFAKEFPKAIYRDFCVLELNTPDDE
jgi:hypothetical protein